MDKKLTWFGPFEGTGAYPTINRQFSAAMERRGWCVLRNRHNDADGVTPVAIAHVYPPRSINLRHSLNIALTAWEFPGERSVPRSFVEPLQSYDVVCAPAQWTADVIGENIDCPVQVVPWGYDPGEFAPHGDVYPLNIENKTIVLWAGGTDQRHGFDIAVKVIDCLPDDYHLVAKQSVNYPPDLIDHPRITIIRDDLPSMAPLYRAADVFLHSARGVGFALHVLESIACGTPVASTPLDAVRAFASGGTAFSDGGEWVAFDHHLHTDCLPMWYEPDIDSLAETVYAARYIKAKLPDDWTWDARVEHLEGVIERATVAA
ncbi:MAG: glycosyltransferase [Planctomycetota bacterium]|jgi:glycosyltransferase involved in cell wall biosynthesis